MFRAQILLAGAARRAIAAADPGIDRDAPAHACAGSIRAGGFNHSGNLVTERERQHAVLGDVEPLVAAEREIAVLHMQVGMADPATLDADEDFGAVRPGAVHDRLAERLAISDQRLAAQLRH